MTDPKTLTAVAEFHKTFKHPILEKPTIPDEKRCRLRVSLIAEELKELEEAIANNDLVEVADALCDIQYVLSGAVLEFGLAAKFSALFDEVQRSNMSKACKSLAEAEETVRYYSEERNTPCFYEKQDAYYFDRLTEDRNTLESAEYSPADLQAIIER